MKSKLKNGWRSVVPLHKQGESAIKCSTFAKSNSTENNCSFEKFPVYLNVYDLTFVNGYFYWAGLGVFHSGIEVHGTEYAFGAHEYPTSGIFEVEPRQCPGFKFRTSIFIGTTYLKPDQISRFLDGQAKYYLGDTYHLVIKNCNHFAEDICYELTGKKIPKWVNRLARIGSFYSCILPESIKTRTVDRDFDCEDSDYEKKSLRISMSCFSSICLYKQEREPSISSLFLHSHYKGCLRSL